MGFIIHFYIIFGTNLLTEEAQCKLLFFAYFSVSQKRNIKRSPNWWNLRESYFWNKRNPRDLEWTSRSRRGSHKAGGHTPHPRGPLVAPPTYFFRLYILLYPKNIRGIHEPLFHCRNLLYPWDPILGPFPASCQRGTRSRRASTSTP